jgi:hypothetical protein
MNDFEGQPRQRQVIVDVQALKASGHRRRKRKRNRHNNVEHLPRFTVEQAVVDDDDKEALEQTIPLELRPVVDATMAYAKQTHALGILRGTKVIESLVERLELIATRWDDPEFASVISDARASVSVLRSEFVKGYSIEDEVPGV